MVKVLMVLIIFLISCSHLQYKHYYTNNPQLATNIKTINIYIDKNFTKEDQKFIIKGISQWNYALNNQMLLNIIDYNFDMEPLKIKKAIEDGSFLILKVNSDNLELPDKINPEKCKNNKTCSHTLAWCDKIGGNTIKIVRDRISHQENLEYITLHEIGHLLYLSHQPKDNNSLMYPYFSDFSYSCIEYESIIKVSEKYNLNQDYLNYCIKY